MLKSISKRKFRLQTTITLLVCVVVIMALAVTDILITNRITTEIENSQAEKATNIAKIVAASPLVIDALKGKTGEEGIQTFANEMKQTTNVEFVVVMDMMGIRKSHPDRNKIGKHFVGGDEGPVLKGKEHISTARGTLGLSLRSFIPIFDNQHKQIGAVAVGISLEKVNQEMEHSRNIIYIGVFVGLFVGILGAMFLARKIKSILLGLEPGEIAKLLEERSAMLQSTKEGMLAVDEAGTITLVNQEGLRLFKKAGIHDAAIGKPVDEFLPNSRLTAVLESGQTEFDQEQDLNGMTILTNRVPILVKGQIVGAIATFREKTEIQRLAEQLTGVKLYAEALRTQSHEFMNKLHVISGLIHMENYQTATTYIEKIVDHQQNEVEFIVGRFKDPILAGFILGKLSYAREKGGELVIDGEGMIPEPLETETTHEIVTVLGNLIDNALDAVKESPVKKVSVLYDYYEDLLVLEIHDTGKGIRDDLHEQVFQKGFSTKGQNRGLGLSIVQKSLGKLNGKIEMHTIEGKGTTFIVTLPYMSK